MSPDLHTTSGKIDDLREKIDEAIHAGSARAVEKQHAKGKHTARERIEMLVDADSFTEIDEFARHRSTQFGMEKTRPYGDGVVIGTATVDGRPIALYSQDFTVFGGSLGEVHADKIVKIAEFALKSGIPLIGINDSGGARIQEGVASLKWIRKNLPTQHSLFGCYSTNFPHSWPMCRRIGLLPRTHRLHHYGERDFKYVYHWS
jgi:propionyl-CoA carboxylase beta chain